jgi:hypothetical protein
MGYWIVTLCILLSSQALMAEEFRLFCSSTQTTATLFFNPIDTPTPGDDCDPSYNEDCGRIVGQFVLTADLSNFEASLVDANIERIVARFNEPAAAGGLLIQDNSHFEIQTSQNFLADIRSHRATPIRLTSHVALTGPDTVPLVCIRQ